MAIDPRKVLPTKINLIRLRREYSMLQRIRRVMEEKREVILHYLVSVSSEYTRYQEEVLRILDKIYSDYYVGLAYEGMDRVKVYTAAIEESLRVSRGSRRPFRGSSRSLRRLRGS